MILCINLYKVLLSPLLGKNCRFHPTCSSYAIEAIQVYGPFKGFFIAMKRISKCHPFHPGGVDLVKEN